MNTIYKIIVFQFIFANNNNYYCIVRGLLVAVIHLSAEKKIQFAENSLVVYFFFLQCFACEKQKLGKGIRR